MKKKWFLRFAMGLYLIAKTIEDIYEYRKGKNV